MPKKILFTILLCTILTLPYYNYGQEKYVSYKKRWEVINADTVSKEKKLLYLDSYIEKARSERNNLEEYRALESKTYLLPFNQAVILLHKMDPLVQNLKNDSLSGDFLNRSTTLYYKNRHFKEALDYAIQAETFNEKINNKYNLNAAKVTIGNIYYHTQHYKKALEYFTKANNYYQKSDNYSHVQGYIASLYSLNKCYWKLEDIKALQKTINANEQALFKLKPQDRVVEAAYLNYLKGGYAFLNKDYNTAQAHFEKALPEIQKNEDITNEYVIYLYLGKIKWKQGQKAEAVAYFTKIDDLFKGNKFLNYELREAYNYLRTYYKDTKQVELQLQTTESLIALNQQFEKEQQYLTDVLHYQLETKQLESEKITLQQQLKSNKNPLKVWLIGLISAIVFISALFIWKKQKKKNGFTVLPEYEFADVNSNETVENNSEYIPEDSPFKPITENVIDDYQAEVKEVADKPNKVSATEQRLLDELNIFEEEKKFKNSITLDQMAVQLKTNRTTLSNFLNTYKGGYNNYLSKLRVAEVVIDVKTDSNLHKKTLHELSVIYGFSNAKAFSFQFKTEMGISPTEFIKNVIITQTNEYV